MTPKAEDKTSSNQKEPKEEAVEIEYITEKKRRYTQQHEQEKQLKNKLKKKESEIKLLKKEITKLKDEYLRQLAEQENLRKRMEREKSEYYDYALSEFLKELLVVLDNFERALEAQDESDGKSFREGIQMIYKQLCDLLLKQGVTPIEVKEKKFDPYFHQAFATEESEEVKEPQISEELQRGYKLRDRLLRPSLVKVIVPKKGK